MLHKAQVQVITALRVLTERLNRSLFDALSEMPDVDNALLQGNINQVAGGLIPALARLELAATYCRSAIELCRANAALPHDTATASSGNTFLEKVEAAFIRHLKHDGYNVAENPGGTWSFFDPQGFEDRDHHASQKDAWIAADDHRVRSRE